MGLAPEQHQLIKLNTNQLSIYLDEITHPGTLQNAFGNFVELKHRPYPDKLVQAIQSIVDESPLLRSRLGACDIPTADVAYLVTRQQVKVHLHMHDWSRDNPPEELLQQNLLKLMHRPYRLAEEDLVSYHLVNAGAQRFYLL